MECGSLRHVKICVITTIRVRVQNGSIISSLEAQTSNAAQVKLHITLHPNPWQPLITIVLSFWKYHINGIIQNVTFSNCLFKVSIMSLSFIHVVMGICSFSLPSSIPLYGHTTVCLCIHPLKNIRVVSSF